MDYSQFLIMKGELLLLVAFVLVFLLDTFGGNGVRNRIGLFSTVLFAVVTLLQIVCGCCCSGSCVPEVSAFGGMYQTTPVVSAIKTILNLGVLIVMIQSLQWSKSDDMKMRSGEFFELILVTLFGMYLMVSARHFMLFVIGLECASLPLAAMAAFNKNKYESHEAAIKYVMTAVFSSAILMMGLSFVYALSGNGSLYFDDIATAIVSKENSLLLICAVAFVIAGFGFKLSLVPFHLWTADTYQGASHQCNKLFVRNFKRICCCSIFDCFVSSFRFCLCRSLGVDDVCSHYFDDYSW